MISQCPHCQQELNLTDAQRQKVEDALKALSPGKSLKVGCPHCRNPINLKADGTPLGERKEAATAAAAAPKPAEKPKVKTTLEPPKAPDVDWLSRDDFTARDVIEDIPLALILVHNDTIRTFVRNAFEELGYKAVFAESATEAIEKMRFTNYAAVVNHSDFEDGKLVDSEFHKYMNNMAMTKRRYIVYILVGPEFHTLYDLEALACSANIVVNDSEAEKMDIILKKGLNDYENLFGPFLGALNELGRK